MSNQVILDNSQASAPPVSLEQVEREHILYVLEHHQGNRTHAAKTLEVSARTLQRKLKAWGMSDFLLHIGPPANCRSTQTEPMLVQ